jgi:hypothetical protein
VKLILHFSISSEKSFYVSIDESGALSQFKQSPTRATNAATLVRDAEERKNAKGMSHSVLFRFKHVNKNQSIEISSCMKQPV